MSVLKVGLGEPYTTIQSAVTAAAANDIVLVSPGDYDESVLINKRVHLRADTAHPYLGIVRLTSSIAEPLIINYSPAVNESIYIEGFEVERKTGINKISFYIQSSNKKLSLYLNRCRLLNKEATGRCLDVYGGAKLVKLTNCYISSEYLHIVNMLFTDSVTLEKTELNKTFEGLNGDLTLNDSVTQSTYLYGPEYGDFLVSTGSYAFSGTVTLNGIPTDRTVKAYVSDKVYYSYNENKETYVFAGSTTSSGGNFYLTTTYSGYHDVICEDGPQFPEYYPDGHREHGYNSLIYSNVLPIPIPNSENIP